VEYNGNLDLTDATSSYLSFWARYRAENFRDKMQVQVSGDNGATWTAIDGTHTIKEPGTLDDATLNGQPALTGIHDYWEQETFDLSAYNGETVRLRFEFTSDDDPSGFLYETDEGFFIDNLKVVKTTTLLVTLPVDFINFTGTLLSDNTVKLFWDATTDKEHDHFIVERSGDGVYFTSLGRGPQSAPYTFIDVNPLNGKNYYRIKQVNKDGSFTYSKIINVTTAQESIVKAFPNPVGNMLSIRLNNPRKEQLTIEIADVNGKKVYTKTTLASENMAELKVDARTWLSGIYILKVVNAQGAPVSTEKIVKL